LPHLPSAIFNMKISMLSNGLVKYYILTCTVPVYRVVNKNAAFLNNQVCMKYIGKITHTTATVINGTNLHSDTVLQGPSGHNATKRFGCVICNWTAEY